MRNRGEHLGDTRLKHRVKQYLRDSGEQYVDIGILAADLQRLYSSDYGRRKRNAFRIQVDKVYRSISNEMLNFEEEHLAKRARQSHTDNGGDPASDSSDSEDYPEYPLTNQLNSSLLSLYRKTNPEPTSPWPAKKMPEGDSTDRRAGTGTVGQSGGTLGGTGLPVGGWFIDRSSGLRHSEGGVVNERETAQSSERTEDSHVDRCVRKRRRLKKGKQRDGAESQDVDGQIESSILNRKVGRKGFELQHSTVKFEDVGGSEETLKAVCQLLIHMRHPEVYQQLGVVPPRGFLLHGPPGCGKTLLAQAIVGELELPMLKVAATEIVSGVSGESEQKLRELFEEAVLQAPCVIFIDEIDAISPKREIASKDMERRIVAQLLTCMDDMNNLAGSTQVLVIGATNRPDSLDPALRRAGRFDREICLGIPSERSREQILRTLCRKLKLPESFDFHQLSRLTPGYVGADLMALCREAAMSAVNRILIQRQEENTHRETLKECGSLELLQKPELDQFERLLALLKDQSPVPEEELQKLCIEMADFTLTGGQPHPEEAVANESGLNFISVKGPELLNMYVGESERAVRQVFQRARNSAPCVIFFDELDSLCPRRSEHESGASVRVVNQLLTEMDGLQARKQVFIMAATNRPDIIDPAILRPGRLDKTLYVGLPQAADRFAILQTLTKFGTCPLLDPDVDLFAIASDQRSDSFTGADLSALVREASINALRQHLSDRSPERASVSAPSLRVLVARQHFEEAFDKVRPSVSKKDQLMYELLRQSLSR
ncbi:nuclear valosin-containing protein-like [Carcharodon carcharias]|uniref:nuclear valosin-containing protein-like n=1 Tax=Carcharodon carcharias TaxID=13397 RepID=UPI001B7EE3BC|nr:nuclear valosin-containing protein-like [Carcharodon carcharias]